MAIAMNFSVQIDCPVDVVCDVVTDLERMPEWFSVKAVRKISGPLQTGATFQIINEVMGKEQVIDYQVVDFTPCQVFKFQSGGKHPSAIDLRLAPEEGGTCLSLNFQLQVNRLVASMVRAQIRNQITGDLTRLAEMLQVNGCAGS